MIYDTSCKVHRGAISTLLGVKNGRVRQTKTLDCGVPATVDNVGMEKNLCFLMVS